MGRVSKSLRHAWNLFQDPPKETGAFSTSMTMPPGRAGTLRYYNNRSIVDKILTRLSVDFAMVDFMHTESKDGIPVGIVENSSLHDILTLDPNIDQSAFALKLDFAYTMFEVGHAALVPVDAKVSLETGANAYDMESVRVGTIKAWHPRSVTVEVYDDREFDSEGKPVNGGIFKQVVVPKSEVVIVQNPFYSTMNAPNSTLQRLKDKIAIADKIDDDLGSSALNLIMQLPYTTKSDRRREQAHARKSELVSQLKDDPLGIGYIDASEKVIQLNRKVDNQLVATVEGLTQQVYDEYGLTVGIMNSSATADELNTYYDRTIEPCATATALEIKRKWITKHGRNAGQSIEIYRDPLKLVPLSELAEITDKVLRNAAITANELRPKIGFFPSKDPAANQLRNPNMPDEDQMGGRTNDEEQPT